MEKITKPEWNPKCWPVKAFLGSCGEVAHLFKGGSYLSCTSQINTHPMVSSTFCPLCIINQKGRLRTWAAVVVPPIDVSFVCILLWKGGLYREVKACHASVSWPASLSGIFLVDSLWECCLCCANAWGLPEHCKVLLDQRDLGQLLLRPCLKAGKAQGWCALS